MGRRKISIAPIADDRNRSVTFLKRKNGLFKKAFELGILCSADVAVIVFSNTGKLFEFSSGNMDQTLLRYSHYNGPSHEKRGPADYAAKQDLEEIAKLGLGGKMTSLEDGGAMGSGASQAGDDDEIDDDASEDEDLKPAPAPKGKGKQRKAPVAKRGSASAGRSTSVDAQRAGPSSSPAEYDAARNLVAAQAQAAAQQAAMPPYSTAPYSAYPNFPPSMAAMGMAPPGGNWAAYANAGARAPGQSPVGLMSGPNAPGSMGPPMAGLTAPPGWFPGGGSLPAGFMHPGAPPWLAMQAGIQQHAFGGQPPNGAMGLPMGYGSPAPPPDFAALQAAYQQSQQSAAHAFFASGHQPQTQGYDPSAPAHATVQTPQQLDPHQSLSRPTSTQPGEQNGTNSRASSVAPPRRADSGSLKPRLSVSIPGGGSTDDGRGGRVQQGGSIVDPERQNSQFTEEPEGIDDGQVGRANELASTTSRFAADLLPSPSTFLADFSSSNAGNHHGYSLAGLNTAIAMANDDARGSVFQWPKAEGAEGEHENNKRQNVTIEEGEVQPGPSRSRRRVG